MTTQPTVSQLFNFIDELTARLEAQPTNQETGLMVVELLKEYPITIQKAYEAIEAYWVEVDFARRTAQ